MLRNLNASSVRALSHSELQSHLELDASLFKSAQALSHLRLLHLDGRCKIKWSNVLLL